MIPNLSEKIISNYNLSKETTGEFMRKILTLDNGRLYMNALSLTDIGLFVDENIEEKIKDKIDQLEEEKKDDNTNCSNFVIAKQYMDFDELNEDNDNPDIYYDEKYDETRYDILDEFKEKASDMKKDEFKEFLISHLIQNVGLTEIMANIEAEAMINKKRRVSATDYAFTLDDYGKNVFYKRSSDNKWIHDKDLDGMPVSKELFCNLKKSCISINKQCGDIQINKDNIKKHLINEMLSNFENQAILDNEKLTNIIKRDITNNLSRIIKLTELHNNEAIKYDRVKKSLANSLQDREIIISEYTELRDLILSQDDFVSKQNNILKFIEMSCRPAQEEKNEEKEWFYCNKTNTKLMPTFYETLARGYLMGDYKNVLDKIAAERGELSDDGDKIVDKYSGFIIKSIDFDNEEGYDEGGYKLVSRAVIDEDISDKMISTSSLLVENKKSKRGAVINNILLNTYYY